jgi:PAS domain S-box-containing protein
MSDHAVESTGLHDLRTRAASRLIGAASKKGSTAGPADALTVLLTLASSPATAADALALLHELQVHQVELDLQAEELRESRAELESALRRQIDLYDFQPVGCFTVDHKLIVRELNQAGAEMLGLERDAACGLGLDKFLSSSSTDMLQTMVSRAAQREPATATTLQWRSKDGPSRLVHAQIGCDPSGDGCLVVLMDAGADRAPGT